MQKESPAYWGIVMYVPGQKRVQWLKQKFAERLMAQRCCERLQRSIPNARFAVRALK